MKWEYLDAAMNAERKQTEYNNALKECEMCLVLYWNRFGGYTEEELTTAYEGVKSGENPKKLYVYFKEPVEDITPELKDFKANFATQYGHFYCKFENVDTMRLNFLLQFEQYQSKGMDDSLVEVKHSEVQVGGEKIADLKKVPFAGNNPDYIQKQESLQKLQTEIVSFETIMGTLPAEAKAPMESMLLQKRMDRERLVKEIEEMEKSLMDTAKTIVKMMGKASSARLERAIELFNRGDNKGANAVLDFDEIKADMEQNARRIDQARELEQASREALMTNIEECQLKVKTLATLHKNLHQYEKSEAEYVEAIGIYRELAAKSPEAYLPDVARNVGNLATLHRNLHQYEKSEAEYGEAIAIYRELAEKSPEAYLPNVALNVGNLANLHSDLRQYEKSEAEYGEAVAIYRELAAKSPEAYLPKVALNVGNLATLHSDLNQYEKAEAEYVEAIAIYRELAEKSPEAYLPDVAGNVGNLALLHSDLHQYEKAEAEYVEAIAIYRELAEKSPEAYLPDVARNVGNLANLHSDLRQYEKSEAEYGEAIAIYRELAEKSPEAYLPDVALNVGNLATLHKNLHQYEKAEAEYGEAIGIYRELAEKSPEAYLPDVACFVGNLANLHFDLHQYEKSEAEYVEAIGIYRELAAKSPEAYLPDVARNVGNLAGLHYDLHQYEKSEAEYGEAIAIYQRFINAAPEFYREQLGGAYNMLAYCLLYQNNLTSALTTINKAISIDPQTPDWKDSKGEILLKMGDTEGALQMWNEVMALDPDFNDRVSSDLYNGLKEKGLLK